MESQEGAPTENDATSSEEHAGCKEFARNRVHTLENGAKEPPAHRTCNAND